jgi:hypothetical protein
MKINRFLIKRSIFLTLFLFALVVISPSAFAVDTVTITAAFKPGETAYAASNKVHISSPSGGTVIKYVDHTPSCGVARVILAYSKDGKSITSEIDYIVDKTKRIPNSDGPRPTMLVGAHLDQGWYKFVPMSENLQSYCRGTIWVQMP